MPSSLARLFQVLCTENARRAGRATTELGQESWPPRLIELLFVTIALIVPSLSDVLALTMLRRARLK